MSTTESSASAHPPPSEARAHRPQMETRICSWCEGSGYTVIDHRYVPTTGILTVIEGPCVACRGTDEVSVFVYGGSGA